MSVLLVMSIAARSAPHATSKRARPSSMSRYDIDLRGKLQHQRVLLDITQCHFGPHSPGRARIYMNDAASNRQCYSSTQERQNKASSETSEKENVTALSQSFPYHRSPSRAKIPHADPARASIRHRQASDCSIRRSLNKAY